jgi:NADH-quinone oxidoreductase subunit L
MNDEVDMRRYGGLAAVMRITTLTFGACYLAIIGIPPFSGFFAKDTVIDAAFHKGGTGGWILGLCALIGAGLTAFYMTRVMLMTFAGKRRWEDDAHPHEAPPVMTWPVILLAIGALGFGAFEILGDRLAKFLGPVSGYTPPEPAVFSTSGIVALALIVVGVGLAWAIYGRRPVQRTAPAARFPVTAARKDLYGDAINESLLMRPGQWLTRLSVYFDNRGVDGLVNTVAAVVGGTSGRMRRIQTGFVRSYALSMFLGGVLLVGALLLARI